MKSLTTSLGLVAALSGCAAVGPAFAPVHDIKPGQGILYIYRPETRALSALSAVFSIDGQKVTTLENNGYAALSLAAGQHQVRHEWKAGIIGNSDLESKPVFTNTTISEGQATYIRLVAHASSQRADAPYPSIGIKTQFRWALEEVRETVAIPELQSTKSASIGNQP